MRKVKDKNKFLIYRHIRPDKDEPFYIGIGDKYRPYNCIDGRNKHWKGIYEKNNKNIVVEIMEDDLMWEEAIKKEMWWIAFYGRKDKGTGILVNMTDGGEGGYGRINTPEQIEEKRQRMLAHGDRIRAARTKEGAEKNTLKGVPRTEEVKKKISAAKMGKKKTVTDKVIALHERRKRGNANKAIKVINTETKEIYHCIVDAAESCGLTAANLARQIAGRRKNKTKFIYLTDYKS